MFLFKVKLCQDFGITIYYIHFEINYIFRITSTLLILNWEFTKKTRNITYMLHKTRFVWCTEKKTRTKDHEERGRNLPVPWGQKINIHPSFSYLSPSLFLLPVYARTHTADFITFGRTVVGAPLHNISHYSPRLIYSMFFYVYSVSHFNRMTFHWITSATNVLRF